MSKCYENNESVAWQEACENVSNSLFLNIYGHTIERWRLTCLDNNYKLESCELGKHVIASNINLFLLTYEDGKEIRDNDDIYQLLQSWVLSNLEQLITKIIGKKTNDFLQPHILQDPLFLQQCRLSYLAKPSSIRR